MGMAITSTEPPTPKPRRQACWIRILFALFWNRWLYDEDSDTFASVNWVFDWRSARVSGGRFGYSGSTVVIFVPRWVFWDK